MDLKAGISGSDQVQVGTSLMTNLSGLKSLGCAVGAANKISGLRESAAAAGYTPAVGKKFVIMGITFTNTGGATGALQLVEVAADPGVDQVFGGTSEKMIASKAVIASNSESLSVGHVLKAGKYLGLYAPTVTAGAIVCGYEMDV